MVLKSIFSFLLILFLSHSVFGQEKKTAALAPLASMGDLDDIQKRVIFNTLQESLSKYYILSSQKMYEKAGLDFLSIANKVEETLNSNIIFAKNKNKSTS